MDEMKESRRGCSTNKDKSSYRTQSKDNPSSSYSKNYTKIRTDQTNESSSSDAQDHAICKNNLKCHVRQESSVSPNNLKHESISDGPNGQHYNIVAHCSDQHLRKLLGGRTVKVTTYIQCLDNVADSEASAQNDECPTCKRQWCESRSESIVTPAGASRTRTKTSLGNDASHAGTSRTRTKTPLGNDASHAGTSRTRTKTPLGNDTSHAGTSRTRTKTPLGNDTSHAATSRTRTKTPLGNDTSHVGTSRTRTKTPLGNDTSHVGTSRTRTKTPLGNDTSHVGTSRTRTKTSLGNDTSHHTKAEYASSNNNKRKRKMRHVTEALDYTREPVKQEQNNPMACPMVNTDHTYCKNVLIEDRDDTIMAKEYENQTVQRTGPPALRKNRYSSAPVEMYTYPTEPTEEKISEPELTQHKRNGVPQNNENGLTNKNPKQKRVSFIDDTRAAQQSSEPQLKRSKHERKSENSHNKHTEDQKQRLDLPGINENVALTGEQVERATSPTAFFIQSNASKIKLRGFAIPNIKNKVTVNCGKPSQRHSRLGKRCVSLDELQREQESFDNSSTSSTDCSSPENKITNISKTASNQTIKNIVKVKEKCSKNPIKIPQHRDSPHATASSASCSNSVHNSSASSISVNNRLITNERVNNDRESSENSITLKPSKSFTTASTNTSPSIYNPVKNEHVNRKSSENSVTLKPSTSFATVSTSTSPSAYNYPVKNVRVIRKSSENSTTLKPSTSFATVSTNTSPSIYNPVKNERVNRKSSENSIALKPSTSYTTYNVSTNASLITYNDKIFPTETATATVSAHKPEHNKDFMNQISTATYNQMTSQPENLNTRLHNDKIDTVTQEQHEENILNTNKWDITKIDEIRDEVNHMILCILHWKSRWICEEKSSGIVPRVWAQENILLRKHELFKNKGASSLQRPADLMEIDSTSPPLNKISVFDNLDVYNAHWYRLVLLEIWAVISKSYSEKNEWFEFNLERHSIDKMAYVPFAINLYLIKNISTQIPNLPCDGDFVLLNIPPATDTYFGFVRHCKYENVENGGKIIDLRIQIGCHKKYMGPVKIVRVRKLNDVRHKLNKMSGFFLLPSSPLRDILLNPCEENMISANYSKIKEESFGEQMRKMNVPVNEDQEKVACCVAATLFENKSSLSVIVGPAGTGKTHTIVVTLLRLLTEDSEYKRCLENKILICLKNQYALKQMFDVLRDIQINFNSKQHRCHSLDADSLIYSNSQFYNLKGESVNTNYEISEVRTMLQSANLIFMDVQDLGSENLLSVLQSTACEIETVIIDDAHLVTELHCLMPLMFGMKKLVLVGDLYVQEARVDSEVAASCGMKYSLINRVYDVSDADCNKSEFKGHLHKSNLRVYVLSKQMRMFHTITDLCTRLINSVEGKMSCFETVPALSDNNGLITVYDHRYPLVENYKSPYKWMEMEIDLVFKFLDEFKVLQDPVYKTIMIVTSNPFQLHMAFEKLSLYLKLHHAHGDQRYFVSGIEDCQANADLLVLCMGHPDWLLEINSPTDLHCRDQDQRKLLQIISRATIICACIGHFDFFKKSSITQEILEFTEKNSVLFEEVHDNVSWRIASSNQKNRKSN